MKKFPKPWYRPSRGVWYVTLNEQQINLGSDRDEAFRKYAQLLAAPQIGRQALADSLLQVIDTFLEWVQKHRSPDTYIWYQQRLELFAQRYRDLRADEVRPCAKLSISSLLLRISSQNSRLQPPLRRKNSANPRANSAKPSLTLAKSPKTARNRAKTSQNRSETAAKSSKTFRKSPETAQARSRAQPSPLRVTHSHEPPQDTTPEPTVL